MSTDGAASFGDELDVQLVKGSTDPEGSNHESEIEGEDNEQSAEGNHPSRLDGFDEPW